MADGDGTTPDPLELISLADAAARLNVSVRTVRRFITYGYLKGHRVGPRLLRVRAGDVSRMVRQLPEGYGDEGGDVP
jgi:excisionase family DNA binding protein